MKKYIIKYSNGREQNIMQAVHSSYNEAAKTLMDYLNAYNDCLSLKNDDYLTPFDFTLEEVECKEINEVIMNFESATKALGADFSLFTKSQLKDVLSLMTSINPKHIKALVALNKLFTIAEAWNKEDGFVPDFSDSKQDKWFPWFKYDEVAAKLIYVNTGSTSIDIPVFGSRLCFKSSARAEQFGKQFINLYNKVFL